MPTIVLPRSCDRVAARGIYNELTEAQGSDAICVDGSKVEKFSQAALQVLVSASKTGEGIVIVEASEKLQSAIAMCGLGCLLDAGEAV
ncbi:STAS domain-containing protein [Altererythrobacter lutimaris]|uniref:STAS domain-containing protein n=1 Tax=Altererythrobacter lutimaris TaxID=2743979 RepID=A0A850HC32_9SPHN|nr:STAS domain-containing protein [Altererythrobacter lutimaris]NVE95319.1 STAS domain-containing protein [Altererythrobacter lutimaris]